jgi:hypothetical protein
MLIAMCCCEAPSRVADLVRLFANAPARSSNRLALESENSCEAFDEIARTENLGEALEAYVCNALALVSLGQQLAVRRNPSIDPPAAFAAAAMGLALNVRLQIIRPQCVARLALIDGTREDGPRISCDVWFDVQNIPPMFRAARSGLVMAGEIGLDVVAALAFALRDCGNNRKAASAQPFGAGSATRERGPAAGSGTIHPMQCRDAVQAATFARADYE